jgi:hypothetical protein
MIVDVDELQFPRTASCGDGNPIAAVFRFLLRVNGNGAALRELIRVAHKIEQRLPQPHRVGMQRANCAIGSGPRSGLCSSPLAARPS